MSIKDQNQLKKRSNTSMPAPFDPRKNELPSTYLVQGRRNKEELARAALQDQMITMAMGGVLPEQPDPTVFRHVLDIGSETGGWLIAAAQTYPAMSLVGIDISQRLVKYAHTQAIAQQVSDRVDFQLMDALGTLKFSADTFDLVNLRFGVGFLRTWEWPRFLRELLRVTRSGGIVRLTDGNLINQCSSPALRQIGEMFLCALFRSGHLFTNETNKISAHLPRLLAQYGCQQVQTKTYSFEYRSGTTAGQALYENMLRLFRTHRPFVEKWGCASKEYDTLYQQALQEMQDPDFFATGDLLTAWGVKPCEQHVPS